MSRLDFPKQPLPEELQRLLNQVLQDARLSEEEARAVRRDLTEHLQEGLARGRSQQELAARFGDPKLAAELIRRSRRSLRLNDSGMARGPRLKEEKGWSRVLQTLRFDLGLALRSLKRNPGYAVTAILLLALGTGVNTAIFSVLRTTLLNPLSLPESEELVRPYFSHAEIGIDRSSVTYLDLQAWEEQPRLFSSVAHYSGIGMDLEGDPPRRIFGLSVSEKFFDVFRAAPLEGRLLDDRDYHDSRAAVLVLSKSLWETQFGMDTAMIGSVVRLNGESLTVVGVADSNDSWPSGVQFWIPQVYTPADLQTLSSLDNFSLHPVARLAPGVTLERARTQIAAMAQQTAQENPGARSGWEGRLMRLREWSVGPTLPAALLSLQAAALFVFLIACTNVAGLMATRTSDARRQLALRVALGARPIDLARHLLTESLVLFVLGASAGLLIAVAGLDALLELAPPTIPRLSSAAVEWSEFWFALVFAALAGVIFGLYPAWKAGRQDPNRALREGIGASSSRRASRFRRGLVVAEVSLSVILLIGAGLMVNSLTAVNRDNPGFRLDHLVTFGLFPPADRYPDVAAVESFFARLTESLESYPGVTSAATTTYIPIGGGGIGLGRAHLAEGMAEPPAGPEFAARWVMVGPGLLETLGWPLLKGRAFGPADNETSRPVAILSETLARQIFPDQDPIGQRVRSWRDENVYREIVGVVGDLRLDSVSDEFRPVFVVPNAQVGWARYRNVVLRTAVPPETLLNELQPIVSQIDPLLPVQNPRSGETVFSQSVASREFVTILLGLFAGLGLLVASIGLYGVLSSIVTGRTKELGIRMSLGASRGRTVALVVNQGLVLVFLGTLVGLLSTLALGRGISNLLFETSLFDPPTLIVAIASVLLVSLLAAAVPARRATGIDPVRALKME